MNRITYIKGLSRNNKIPKIPVTPVPVAPSPVMDAKTAPIAPPKQPAIKGLIYLKLTPKIAGSVIPSKAENPDG